MNRERLVEAEKGKRFCEYTEIDILRLEAKLDALADFVGIGKPTADETIKMIINWLILAKPNFRSEELSLSVMMYVSGSFGQLDDSSKQHYGTFNAKFLGMLIQKYETWKASVKIQPAPTPVSHQLSEASNESKWRADYISMIEWIIKDGGVIPPQGNFWQCFQYLKLVGRINPMEHEFLSVINTARSWVEGEIAKMNYPNEKQDFRKQYDQKTDRFKNLCREIYFKEWLQEQMMNNLDDNDSPIKWLESELTGQNAKQTAA